MQRVSAFTDEGEGEVLSFRKYRGGTEVLVKGAGFGGWYMQGSFIVEGETCPECNEGTLLPYDPTKNNATTRDYTTLQPDSTVDNTPTHATCDVCGHEAPLSDATTLPASLGAADDDEDPQEDEWDDSEDPEDEDSDKAEKEDADLEKESAARTSPMYAEDQVIPSEIDAEDDEDHWHLAALEDDEDKDDDGEADDEDNDGVKDTDGNDDDGGDSDDDPKDDENSPDFGRSSYLTRDPKGRDRVKCDYPGCKKSTLYGSDNHELNWESRATSMDQNDFCSDDHARKFMKMHPEMDPDLEYRSSFSVEADNAPYYIDEKGGKFVVFNHAGEVKSSFASKEEALKYQRALMLNVPGAKDKAEEDHGDTRPTPKSSGFYGKPEDVDALREAAKKEEYKHLFDVKDGTITFKPAGLEFSVNKGDVEKSSAANNYDHARFQSEVTTDNAIKTKDPYFHGVASESHRKAMELATDPAMKNMHKTMSEMHKNLWEEGGSPDRRRDWPSHLTPPSHTDHILPRSSAKDDDSGQSDDENADTDEDEDDSEKDDDELKDAEKREKEAALELYDDAPEAWHSYVALLNSDPIIKETAWKDVRNKGLRLRREGKIAVDLYEPHEVIQTTVQGDNGVYTTVIHTGKKGEANVDNHIAGYSCTCDWGKWAFIRETYFGRLCAHGVASYYEKQAMDRSGKGQIITDPFRIASVEDDDDESEVHNIHNENHNPDHLNSPSAPAISPTESYYTGNDSNELDSATIIENFKRDAAYIIEDTRTNDDIADAAEAHLARIAKTSGKQYSAEEQLALIYEDGDASNIDSLNLENSSYLL